MKQTTARSLVASSPVRGAGLLLPFRSSSCCAGARSLAWASRGHERVATATTPLLYAAGPAHRSSHQQQLPLAPAFNVVQRRGYAGGHGYRKARVRALLVDDAITSDVVQLVSLEGRNLGEVALADAKLLAKQKGLRLACVVPLANPPICRLQRVVVVPDVDELDDKGDDDEIAILDEDGSPIIVQPSSSSSSSSSSSAPDIPSPTDNIKRRPKGEKELRFSDAIAEHDVQTKVGQLRRFLSKGLRVRVSINFKSVAKFDVDLARALLDNIISRADDLGRVEGDIQIAHRFASLLLLPTTTPSTTKGQHNDKSDE